MIAAVFILNPIRHLARKSLQRDWGAVCPLQCRSWCISPYNFLPFSLFQLQKKIRHEFNRLQTVSILNPRRYWLPRAMRIQTKNNGNSVDGVRALNQRLIRWLLSAELLVQFLVASS
jgi:hypothetical protein